MMTVLLLTLFLRETEPNLKNRLFYTLWNPEIKFIDKIINCRRKCQTSK